MQLTSDPVIAWIAAATLALVLLVGAAGKLASFDFFEATMAEYRLIPIALASGLVLRASAATLIAAELICAGLLLYGPVRSDGASLTLALLALVTAAVIINLLRGRRDIRCGCGGPEHAQTLSWGLVFRNLVLAAAALIALLPPTERALHWLDLLSIIGGTLAAGGLYFAANQLLANHPHLDALRS